MGSQDGEVTSEAVVLDEAANLFRPLPRERTVAGPCLVFPGIGEGVACCLFVGVADDGGFFRKGCMGGGQKEDNVCLALLIC